MAGDPRRLVLPGHPVSVEEVHRLLPSIRHSLLSSWDLCPLTTLFNIRHGYRLSGPEAAVGIIAHRAFAEILRTLYRTKQTIMPTEEALTILYEVAAQRDVGEFDRVRVPSRYWPHLRLVVIKFAKDYDFSIQNVVSIEGAPPSEPDPKPLAVDVPYEFPDGRRGTRRFTGTPDVLLYDPPDGAVIMDHKTGWSVPPKPRVVEEGGRQPTPEEQARRLSPEGYLQQRHYGYLVMKTYPSVSRVTLREAYIARNGDNVREATLYRGDLEHVERELSLMLADFDHAIAAGPQHAASGGPDDPWLATPGPACRWCLKPNHCPIDADARRAGAITSPEMAGRYAAEYEVAEAVRLHHRDALRTWLTSQPIPYIELRSSKRRRVIGFNMKDDGSQRFEVFTPTGSDLAPVEDPNLAAAFAEAERAMVETRARVRHGRKKVLGD